MMPRKSVGLVMAMTPRYSETFLSSKISGLRKSGFEVRVFVSTGENEKGVYPALLVDRRKVFRSTLSAMWAWSSLVVFRPIRVARFLKAEKDLGRSWTVALQGLVIYQHILMHAKAGWLHFEFASLTIGGESLASAVGAKMSVSLRGHDMTSYPLKNPGCYQHLWRKVDQVHAISTDLIDAACSYGLPESVKVRKICPAIDSTFYQREGKAKSEVLQILTVARLHWKKGLDYVMVALKTLLDQSPELSWKYTIAGSGDQEERLRFTVSELGLSDRVVFAGKRNASQLKDLYSRSDVYVQYSLQEGFCNAVLEAQAMELVCVVSDAEGLRENVGDIGVVVPKRQPDLLAAELLKLLTLSEADRQRIGELARSRVVAEFDLKKQQNQFSRFYSD